MPIRRKHAFDIFIYLSTRLMEWDKKNISTAAKIGCPVR